ncbi:hypothetical protein FRB91_000356 [Serendipita sp. 411]|nr:hypothetical protein FRB91_000356 [Serendipita sp. 411]
MSRQILSYADLGPIKTVVTAPDHVTTSNTHSNSQEGSPLKKRRRTEDDGDDEVSIDTVSKQMSVSESTQHNHTKNRSNKQAQRFRKNHHPRGGLPGAKRSSHWDSQPSDEMGLAYAEENVPPSLHQPHSEDAKTGRSNPNLVSNILPTKNGFANTSRRNPVNKVKETPAAKIGDSLPMGQDDWDDSFLVDAWNAAEQEYMEMHGGKKWRCAPVKFSSLWHSAPTVEKSSDKVDVDDSQVADIANHSEVGEMDIRSGDYISEYSGSAPAIPSALEIHAKQPGFKLDAVSLEEALHKAKEASYALGYWTAIYQMRLNEKAGIQHESKADGGNEEGEEEEDHEEDFLPTQR